MKHVIEPTSDQGYPMLESIVAKRVKLGANNQLFTTSLPENQQDLWDLYLYNLPEEVRQHYNCRKCRDFIEKYGYLVTVGEHGSRKSLLWSGDSVPGMFRKSFEAMESRVLKNAKVDGVFYNSEKVWGTPENVSKNGVKWTHLHGICDTIVLGAYQKMAEKKQDYAMLNHTMHDFGLNLARKALVLLESGTLYRDEKAVEMARWFVKVHEGGIWWHVAKAPPGFCHLRNLMLGTLLTDLKSGLDTSAIVNRWAEKMKPTQYQRPTAAPAEQLIDKAEELVEKLGLRLSFDRRFANIEDMVEFVWRESDSIPPNKIPDGGIFDNLRRPNTDTYKKIALPTQTMTWVKFVEKVLPTAQAIQFYAESGRHNYCALVTAVHKDAPILFQYGNAVSWYFYDGGARALDFNLMPGQWHKVVGIVPLPVKNKTVLLIENCKDLRYKSGAGMFPETLKTEYHGIKRVVEAHVNSTAIHGGAGTANGIAIDGSRLRVITADSVGEYIIDRWD